MAVAVAGHAVDAGLFGYVFLAVLNILMASETFNQMFVYMNCVNEGRIIALPLGGHMAGIATLTGHRSLSLRNPGMAISALKFFVLSQKTLVGKFNSCKGDGNTG